METVQRRSRTWHVRHEIATTVKEGARVGGITVTVDHEEGDEPTQGAIEARLNAAFDTADAVCQRVNREKGFEQ